MTSRAERMLLERGGLVALIATVTYLWLAPHHVVDGDNAEFATLSVTGGAAHPSGYPLYVLWLRALSWLPGSTPAHAAAMATALLGGLTVLVLHAACRRWGARPLAATVAVALYATGPVVLRVVTEAEVFAMNQLAVASVLWLAAAAGPLRGLWRAALLGLVAGLGLSDHLTCALIAPVGLLGVVRGARESQRAAVAIAAAVGGLVLGLAPYAYLLAAPATPMSWGKVEGVRGIVSMFLREDYGGPTAFRMANVHVTVGDNLLALARTLGRGWLWLPAVVGAVAIGWRAARSRDSGIPGEPRTGWVMLGLAWLVAGPVLVSRFNVKPEGLGLYVNQRFHVLPLLLLAPGVAIAVEHLAELVTRDRLAIIITATIGTAALTALSLSYVGRVHSPAVELSAHNMLASLPPDAVIVHSQDELHAVTGYAQWARGQRQDVRVVMWTLVGLDWYRERFGMAWGTSEPAFVADQLARGVPVFVDRLQRGVIDAFPTYPHGVLLRVLPRGTPVPAVRDVFAINEQLFATFALDYPRPGPDDEFATEVHRRYAATWTMISTMLDHVGDRELAARANRHAQSLAPQ